MAFRKLKNWPLWRLLELVLFLNVLAFFHAIFCIDQTETDFRNISLPHYGIVHFFLSSEKVRQANKAPEASKSPS